MGFRKDTWATCWGVEPKSDTLTVVRLSTSRKDRATSEYVQDFSGYVSFIGTAAAKKAANLKERDRIKLGDIEVTTNYVKERNKTYTNFKCFSFSLKGEEETPAQQPVTEPQVSVDDGEVDDRLPF